MDIKKQQRYLPQILFNFIGKAGQEKLKKSRAAVIGCGGLGSVISSSLARAGVGFIRIVDRDRLELSNLQRQILYNEEDLKRDLPKVGIAKQKLIAINSEITVEAVNEEAGDDNIKEMISDVNIVLDATDNLKTRFIINRACIEGNIPWVFGSVAAACGMVLNIIPGKTPCFNCIFSKSSDNDFTLSSANAGVLNTAVSVIASIQATEAIKYLTGNISFMVKTLLILDLWDFSVEKVSLTKMPAYKCGICNRHK